MNAICQKQGPSKRVGGQAEPPVSGTSANLCREQVCEGQLVMVSNQPGAHRSGGETEAAPVTALFGIPSAMGTQKAALPGSSARRAPLGAGEEGVPRGGRLHQPHRGFEWS